MERRKGVVQTPPNQSLGPKLQTRNIGMVMLPQAATGTITSSLTGHKDMPGPSVKIGYALDGFPIFGALENPSSLDECNGRHINGSYQYHVRTLDQVEGSANYCDGTSAAIKWKYHIGCYHGDISTTTVSSRLTTQVPSDCVKVDSVSIGSDSFSSTCNISTIGYVFIVLGAIIGALALGFLFVQTP